VPALAAPRPVAKRVAMARSWSRNSRKQTFSKKEGFEKTVGGSKTSSITTV